MNRLSDVMKQNLLQGVLN